MIVAVTDAERFAAARRAAGYQAAMDEEFPRTSWARIIVTLVVTGMVVTALSMVFVAMQMAVLIAVPAGLWLYLVYDAVGTRRAPTRKVLAIVGGAGSAAGGDAYSGVSMMRRYLFLRTEDGTERDYGASAMAAAGLSRDDIGIATLRGNYVLGFHQLDV